MSVPLVTKGLYCGPGKTTSIVTKGLYCGPEDIVLNPDVCNIIGVVETMRSINGVATMQCAITGVVEDPTTLVGIKKVC